MRIGLLTEGGYPYVGGEGGVWCDRLVRGLDRHEFDVYAFSTGQAQEDAGWVELPPQVQRVRTAPLWTAEEDGVVHGRRARRRFTEHYGELAAALCAAPEPGTAEKPLTAEADRFANALHGLAELARDEGGLVAALRSEQAVRALESACRAPGARRTAHEARVPDLLAVADHLERALRPLSLDWYEQDGLGAVDLCHAASGGVAAIPGLLARHFFGVPLLVTEYGVRLRTHYLTRPDASPAVRSLLAAFHGLLTAETYRAASYLVPGNAHARRWQERCGADRAKLRTIYPGLDATPFTHVGEEDRPEDRKGREKGEKGEKGERREKREHTEPHTLVWLGRVEPAKDLVSLLHAFAEVRAAEPGTRLRIVGRPSGPEGEAYLGHCRALAVQLFPDEADGPHAVGQNPVSFEELGGPGAETTADVHAGGTVTVLSSVVEGFPVGLIEAMFCGRATVSTDVGAVVEVIGGTGLVVPPRNPRALAEACVSLLRDPDRRARLGEAARARALELFSVEQNVAAFHGLYLETVARTPVHRPVLAADGDPQPFAAPAEAHVAGHWTEPTPRAVPTWAVETPEPVTETVR
ncbi:transferase [Streptomyces cellulosae]|nr:transferase [Streptomyces cellulosae]